MQPRDGSLDSAPGEGRCAGEALQENKTKRMHVSRGAGLCASSLLDGDIGHIDQASSELLGASHLVVETGVGRRVLLPAGFVERIDTAEQKIYVDRTKDQIRAAPEYDDWF